MKKLKITKKQVLISLAIVGGLIVVSLVALAFIRPEFKVQFLTSDTFPVEDLSVKADGKYKRLNFTNPHQLTFNTGKKYITSSYKIDNEDVKEGENSVKACAYLDLFLIKLKASKCSDLKIIVDRVAPVLTAESLSPDFVLLSDLKFTIKSEKGVEILNNDKVVATLKSDEDTISFAPVDGLNQVVLRARDKVGNLSEAIKFSFEAFNVDGYSKFVCEGISIPIGPTQQVGYLNSPTDVDKYTKCNDPAVPAFTVVGAGEKYTPPPCTECDYFNSGSTSAFFMHRTGGSLQEIIDTYGTNYGDDVVTNTVVKSEGLTTKSGVKGTLMLSDFEGPLTKNRMLVFVIQKGSYSYVFTKYGTYGANFEQKFYDEFITSVENLSFEI